MFNVVVLVKAFMIPDSLNRPLSTLAAAKELTLGIQFVGKERKKRLSSVFAVSSRHHIVLVILTLVPDDSI